MDDKENWDDLFFIHKESKYYILIQEALEFAESSIWPMRANVGTLC
jgi:hypothetical protein